MSRPRVKGFEVFRPCCDPNLHPLETTQLTVISATALQRAIKSVCNPERGHQMAERHFARRKKAAGILTEMSAETDRVRHVIIGIGVDVNLDAAEFPAELKKIATSLKAETRRKDFARGTGGGNFARTGCGLCADPRREICGSGGRMGIGLRDDRQKCDGPRRVTGSFGAGRNRWTMTARCWCARSTGTCWKRVIGGDVMLENDSSAGFADRRRLFSKVYFHLRKSA